MKRSQVDNNNINNDNDNINRRHHLPGEATYIHFVWAD